MFDKAWWLGLPENELQEKNMIQNDLNCRFAYYRCAFDVPAGTELMIDITASARYRLWVNGEPVNSGPCKGDLTRWYYDTLELTKQLRPGTNVLAVQVLFVDHYATIHQGDERSPIFSVVAPGGTHRLAVQGKAFRPDGVAVDLSTGFADWKCRLDNSYFLKSQKVTDCYGAFCEEIDCSKTPHGWKEPNFDDSDWKKPAALETVNKDTFMTAVGLLQRFPIRERPIPLLYEIPFTLADPGRLSEAVIVPAGQHETFLLDAGMEINAYPGFRFTGGKDSRVRIVYFEKFTGPNAKRKDDRNGDYSGITDTLTLDGTDCRFEPFWVRSFRFIAIEIEAAEDTVVYPPFFRKTGYPLKVISEVRSSEPWLKEVYDLCVRTLETCMLETYMDCPYYEQNQFPMDTRLQALYCSAVSGDMRLTYKALEDFHCSISPDGLVHGRYPASYQQIISTFSLYYIYMLEETWQQTGKIAPLRRYLPDLDRILDYYDARRVASGLVGRLGYWEFVDWQKQWENIGGIPEALLHGPSTIINCMYSLALERGAVLWEAAGRPALADEYRRRKNEINAAVVNLCWDEERGMLREGPRFAQFTQHAQSWATLCGALTRSQARAALTHALDEPDVLRCSFSTAFELFRALEQTDMYDRTKELIAQWAALPAQGNTTCPETPGESRSECHAWSALPIYEFLRVMGGVRMEAGKVILRPMKPIMADLTGQVCVPGGIVRFRYAEGFYEARLPDGSVRRFRL